MDGNDNNNNNNEDDCNGNSKCALEMEVAVDVGGDGGGDVKRRKIGGGEEEMKRVAEIVLVLAAMGRMRGGKDPTIVEKTLMAEARAKVIAMCEEIAPKDIVPVEAFGGVIHDLGLNRFKDRVGFRTAPKQSISEKIAFSKRRMEESKAFASQPASFPSQRTQTGSATANENSATPPGFRAFSSDKPSHIPAATTTFQPPTSTVNVSSAASTNTRFHPTGTQVRSPVVSPALQNNVGKDANSVASSRHDRPHLRSDGKLNGPLPNVPASSGSHQHTVRTTPVHLQPQPLPQVNVGTKSADNKTQGVSHMPGRVLNQTAPRPQPNLNHPVQNRNYVRPPQAVNHHFEISKLVHRLLTPTLSPRPALTPPSRDYMNRAIICQFCKLVINVIENMVVCDACEKGFHLGCLQSYNTKSLPRGEWHCPRCLSMSHGKPFPPKYGRVTRNMNASKAPTNVATVDKVASLPNATTNRNRDSKTDLSVNQPNATTNGSQDLKLQTQAVEVVKPSSESNLKLENCTNTTVAPVIASLSTSITPSASYKPPQQVKPELSSSEDRLMSETELRTPVIFQANCILEELPTSSHQNDVDRKVLESENNGVAESHLSSYDEKQAVQKNLVDIERVHDQAENLSKASESGLHNVEWVGEVDHIVDEKKFFQSCRINGVVYKVRDYAFTHSGNGKLIPLKLQAMWEDSQTSSKRLAVRKCYSPDDLPEEVGHPVAPEKNEVYESTHDSYVLAGCIQGPCEVLPFKKLGEETEIGDQESRAKEGSQPVFIRNWFYDESRQALCPNVADSECG